MKIEEKKGLKLNQLGMMLAVILGLSVTSTAFSAEISDTASSSNVTAEIDQKALEVNELSNSEKVKTYAQSSKVKSSDTIVLDLIEKYKEKENIHEGYNVSSDKSFSSAIVAVGVNSSSPDFGKARVIAFEEAFNKALASYVSSQNNYITTSTLSKLISNNDTDARIFEKELSSGKSNMGAFIDKIIALGDALTSDKLKELGVDPEKYNSAPPDKKKILLEDVMVKLTIETFSKTMGGVTPIQTFIGDDGKGNQSVGIIIMYSSKLQAVADALKRGQKPAIPNKGPALNQLIPREPEKLYDLFGVRVLFDEHGLVVVSYGQWANNYQGDNPQMRSRQLGIAFSQAESIANAQISEFLNSSFSGEVQSQIGKEVEVSIIKEGKSGLTNEGITANMVDRYKEVSRRKSSNLLQGASTFKRWEYETPEGHQIVGVIKVYSFANIKAAKPIKNSSSHSSGTASGRTGEQQMDINTF